MKRRHPSGSRRNSEDTAPIPRETPVPYRCLSCKLFFFVRTGTALGGFKGSAEEHLEGVSGMKLHRDLKVKKRSRG